MTERDVTFLGPLSLEKGAHKRGSGMCAMEAAAYIAGEPHSDHPVCVSPVIAVGTPREAEVTRTEVANAGA